MVWYSMLKYLVHEVTPFPGLPLLGLGGSHLAVLGDVVLEPALAAALGVSLDGAGVKDAAAPLELDGRAVDAVRATFREGGGRGRRTLAVEEEGDTGNFRRGGKRSGGGGLHVAQRLVLRSARAAISSLQKFKLPASACYA